MYCKISFPYLISFLVVSLLFSALSLIAVAGTPVTIEDILEGIRYNESLIKSGKGTLIVKENMTEAGRQSWLPHILRSKEDENPTVWESLVVASESTVSYSFEGIKFRFDIETRNKIWDGETEQEDRTVINQAYDGETMTELRISLNGISGLIESDPLRSSIAPTLDPRDWGIYAHHNMGKPLSEVLKIRRPELVGTEVVEGDLCYIIRSKPSSDPNLSSEEIEAEKRGGIWIDPQKGYGIVKIEHPGVKTSSSTIIRYKEVSEGIWVPYLEESKSFSVDPNTGNQVIESEITRELKDFQVNVDIPDDVFKIVFEKGTEVFDARTKKSYMVE